ncbi:hypothetical protein HHI36_015644 [Cryptolaemus montrouzieri]|uniref:Regulatory protein zeste n=1 Tax=Cryptolaemus montrouzieri TaxID=559131 RepID=A0ABD2N6B4_9CUCU
MSIEKKAKGDNVSETQKELILAFMKDDLKFAAGKFDRNYTHAKAQMKWLELSKILNTFPGPTKDWKSWKRTWQDMKSKTKLKIMKRGIASEQGNKMQDEIMNLIKITEEMYGNCDKDWLEENSDKQFNTLEVDHNERREEETSARLKGIKREIGDIEENDDIKEEIKIIFSREPDVPSTYEIEKSGMEKSAYYDKKLAILERIATAKEESVQVKKKMVCELRNISSLLLQYINK